MAASLNPLRCRTAGLPPNLLLMAKLVVLMLLLTGHIGLLPGGAPMRVLFAAVAVALLLNRAVRLCAVGLGAMLLLAAAVSKDYTQAFCGLLLALTGLYHARITPRLLQLLVIIAYFGAGLNKTTVPDPAASTLVSWTAVAISIVVPLGLLWRRSRAAAIWTSILFQAAVLLVTGAPLTPFAYAIHAAMLSLVTWPSQMIVIWDGDCGFCARTKRFVERFDLDDLYDWHTAQSGIGARFGISADQLRQRLYVVYGECIAGGYRAFQAMALYNPLTWFLAAAALLAPYRRITIAALLALFLPPLRPLGEAVYNLVARNRHRLAPGGVCDIG
jgi:predicted DCC family thiol-disulfide oxidoreductase YuxK